MRSISKYLLLLMLIPNLGQTVSENPRVIEVQEKIKYDISQFLEKFAGGTKYSVQVQVKPLRRKADSLDAREDLPFMEFESDLITDEWDDPNASIYSLINRIAEAKVTIFIESKVKIENRREFKTALLQDVNLIPGRDSVTIETISTPILEKTFEWQEQTEILLLGVMLIIAVILGVGLNSVSNKISPPKMVNSDKSEGEEKSSSPSPSMPMPMPSMSAGNGNSGGGFGEIKGDLNVQDPSKMNELVAKKIDKLMDSETFPILSDMVILEDLLLKDSASFSYLIYELPQEVQKYIYQMGRGDTWFKGFSEVGFPSKAVMIALDKMLQNRNVVQNEKFESLLIHVWRINNHLDDYVKTLTKKQAFAILYYLPKDISIPVARDCYPGSWGSLLEDKVTERITDLDEMQELITRAIHLQPYFNFDSLQTFKNRKDLLKYLEKVEPHEERDIYSVVGAGSDLTSVRPPFFTFFDLPENERKEIFSKFPIADWALASFNIERHERDRIVSIMDQKENYLFSHLLRSYDENPSLTEGKYEVRDKIAKYIHDNYVMAGSTGQKAGDAKSDDESISAA